MPLLYEGLTSQIMKACFEVINELGAGFLVNFGNPKLEYKRLHK